MKRIGMLVGFLAIVVFLLPLTAQDVNKDTAKTDKKDAEKTDEKKKETEKKKDKVVYGAKITTKIVNTKGEAEREYTIETKEQDPKRVFETNAWSVQRQQQLAQQYNNAVRAKDGGQALRNWMRDSQNYQVELAKRQAQTFITKNAAVRAAESAKIRTMTPPIEFD